MTKPINYLPLANCMVILLLVCLFPSPALSQGTWEIYGDAEDQRGSLSLLPSGERALSGIHTGSGGTDAFLIKTSASGAILWDKRYSMSPTPINFNSIPTSDGGYFVGGRISSQNTNLIAVKLDASGNVSWANEILGGRLEAFGDVAESTNGNFVIAGWSETYGPNAGAGQPDGMMIEFGPTGTKNWARGFGGSLGEKLYRVTPTATGYAAVGRSFRSGALDGFLVATDQNGVPTHRYIYYLTGSSSSPERLFDIIQTSDGGFLVTGHYKNGNEDVWLMKLSSSFAVQWAKTYSDGGRNFGTHLAESGGAYYVGGSTNSTVTGLNAIYLKVDLSGNLIWARSYDGGGSDYARDIYPGGGSTIVSGLPTNSFGSGPYGMSVVRFGDAIDSCAMDVTADFTTTNRSFTRDGGPATATQDVTASVGITPLAITSLPGNYSRSIASCSTSFSAVPTLSQWGIIILGLLVLCLGGIVLWRRQYQGGGSMRSHVSGK